MDSNKEEKIEYRDIFDIPGTPNLECLYYFGFLSCNRILYYIITGSIILICSIFGKRVWRRYFCPMYILNYIGIHISKFLKLPHLKVSADKIKCVGCHKCDDACPMGLKVSEMVKSNNWNNYECIQCGECINVCKVSALKRNYGLEDDEKKKM